MPNHISNVVTITGEPTELKQLLSQVKSKNEAFSFEGFYPMPEDIDAKESSAMPSWYTWRVANWGTKWDAYEVSDVFEQSNSFTISFQTAWSTPIGALIKLSSLYPNVEILCEYADEDMGSNVGEYTVKNGEAVSVNSPDYGDESVKLAQKIYEKADELFALSK